MAQRGSEYPDPRDQCENVSETSIKDVDRGALFSFPTPPPDPFYYYLFALRRPVRTNDEAFSFPSTSNTLSYTTAGRFFFF